MNSHVGMARARLEAQLLASLLLEDFEWHPELFGHRQRVIDALERAGFVPGMDYESVDILHEEYGVEVTQVAEECVDEVMVLLARAVPDLPVKYHLQDRHQGWLCVAQRTSDENGLAGVIRKKKQRVPVVAAVLK